jgi:hypothetical protein
MSVRPDVGLERLIDGLELELLAAPDEEFMAGARDLGMNPDMRGSAAFLGVKNLSPQMLEALRNAYGERGEASAARADEECDPPPDPRSASKRNVDA